ncbi:Hypothetical predicted protein [Scomber scombrus]|uniref:Uncharacterized protein n=1 Tax=Scomber scombrus TaxID=13677 RepID=A0AAV1N2K0_SCOSC
MFSLRCRRVVWRTDGKVWLTRKGLSVPGRRGFKTESVARRDIPQSLVDHHVFPVVWCPLVTPNDLNIFDPKPFLRPLRKDDN